MQRTLILNALALAATLGTSASCVAADAGLSITSSNAPHAQMLDAAGEGRRLFLKLNCYGCHGMYAGGGMGPNIVNAERNDVNEVLMRGSFRGMRSYRDFVTDTDITNIAAYLQSIGTPNEPTFKDWWKKNPPK
ncbi:MAG: cytochrome c [Burkholderiales bacterium]|nr:cytochrome c [Burkholderiales bacterium]